MKNLFQFPIKACSGIANGLLERRMSIINEFLALELTLFRNISVWYFSILMFDPSDFFYSLKCAFIYCFETTVTLYWLFLLLLLLYIFYRRNCKISSLKCFSIYGSNNDSCLLVNVMQTFVRVIFFWWNWT